MSQSQPTVDKTAQTGNHALRCPDCGHTENCNSYAAAASLQTSKPCPNCNRMMALSEGSV
jgi:ribosomal protein S27E